MALWAASLAVCACSSVQAEDTGFSGNYQNNRQPLLQKEYIELPLGTSLKLSTFAFIFSLSVTLTLFSEETLSASDVDCAKDVPVNPKNIPIEIANALFFFNSINTFAPKINSL